MSDDTGTLYYTYDELSRLVTESKDFSDTFTHEPSGGVFTLSYQYHLSGSLKSITDPFSHTSYYSADKLGRTTAIGTGSSTPNAYASSIGYRAFGGVKSMTLGTTAATSVTMTYDDALRPASYEADNSTTGSGYVQKANYTYHKDGSVKEIDNLRDSNFDQSNDYDFAGRLKKNQVGSGSSYWQTLAYNAFSNLTDRQTQTWGLDQIGSAKSYTNNRNSDDTYDEAGNVIGTSTSAGGGMSPGGGWYDDNKGWSYDASGRMAQWSESGPWGTTIRGGVNTFDGDGRPAKYAESQRFSGQNTTYVNWYHLFSSVTGQKIADIGLSGTEYGQRVYMGDTLIYDTTYKGPYADAAIYAIGFKVTDPVSASTQQMNADGTVPPDSGQNANPNARNELVALGTSIPAVAPSPYPPNYYHGGYAGSADSGCHDPATYSPMPCAIFDSLMQHLIGIYGSPNDPKRPNGPVLRPDIFPHDAGRGLGADNEPIDPKLPPWIRMKETIRGERFVYSWEVDPLAARSQGPSAGIEPPMIGGPCDGLVPEGGPPGESVLANIKTTLNRINAMREQAKKDAKNVSAKGEPLTAAAATAISGIESPGGPVDQWFKSMVATGNPWDYKKDNPNSKAWEDFGNFNYGAVGAAANYPLGVLERMAGFVQGSESGQQPAGVKAPSLIAARLGTGGEWPYGDEIHDNEQIRNGYRYFNCLIEHGLL